jgi:hypothetical protein
LREFREHVIIIDSTYKYSGQNCTESSRWNFYSSLLFTITVISTIGYGYIAPVTWEGRLVCICYASIGIPLTLICLANLSSSLGKIFIFIYSKLDELNPITVYYKRKLKEKRAKRRKLKQERREKAAAAARRRGGDRPLTNISEDDSAMFLNQYEEEGIPEEEEDDDDEDEHEDLDLEFLKTNQNEVPILVTLLVIFLYIYGGSYLFAKYENWNLVQSAYFSYVTLSTMGFGDLVPGQNIKDPNAQYKLIFICIYSLLGMATLGMCFNVMQGVAKRYVISLVKKIKKIFTFSKEKDEPPPTIMDLKKEREQLIHNIKLLKEYQHELNAKKRKKHIMS